MMSILWRCLSLVSVVCACCFGSSCDRPEPLVVRQAISFYIAVPANDPDAPQSAGAATTWLLLDDPHEWVNRWDDWRENFAELMSHRGLIARMSESGEASILVYSDAEQTMLPNDTETWEVLEVHKSKDQLGRSSVAFTLDARGALRMRELTSNHMNETLAIAVDGIVLSVGRIHEPLGNSGMIVGSFTDDEINDLLAQLHESGGRK